MKDRGVRRNQMARMKQRARKLWERWNPTAIKIFNGRVVERSTPKPTNRWVGHMASTHNKPCSCSGCGNPRNYDKDGRTTQEQRSELEPIGVLATEESMSQIRREVSKSECEDPNCDCHEEG